MTADFRKAVAAYTLSLRARRRTPRYAHTSERVLAQLFAFLKSRGIEDLREVRESHLVAFGRELKRASSLRGRRQVRAPATQANYLRTAIRFFEFLAKRGLLLADPAAELTVPEWQRLPRLVLTPAQAQRLMTAPSPYSQLGKRDRAILELLYGTGIRRGECVRLDVTDVDLQQARLFIRDGKGKQDRIVPIPGAALSTLERYLVEVRPEYSTDPRERALFIGLGQRDRGGRLTEGRIHKIVVAAAARAGLGHVFPHALRHTCATHVLQGGADVRYVQELLGHRQLRTTAIYTRVDTADLKAALDRCHPRERKRRARKKK